jgi:hypothetical protein
MKGQTAKMLVFGSVINELLDRFMPFRMAIYNERT